MDEFEKWWNSDEAQMDCDGAVACNQSHKSAFETGLARGHVMGMGESDWSKTPPTVSGWYWWRQHDKDEPEVCRVTAEQHCAEFPADCDVYSFSRLGGEWIGPITPTDAIRQAVAQPAEVGANEPAKV